MLVLRMSWTNPSTIGVMPFNLGVWDGCYPLVLGKPTSVIFAQSISKLLIKRATSVYQQQLFKTGCAFDEEIVGFPETC
ncbi:hypothetical protein HI914_02006 [Erysiphe necator]|nr:hypothetical protein HI914_02006 [Erysiphe necator]